MLIVAVSFLTYLISSILLVVGGIQTTWPDSKFVKSKRFKYGAFIVIFVAASLMFIGEIHKDQIQDNLREALNRIALAGEKSSTYVFPRDITFDFLGTYSPPTSLPENFSNLENASPVISVYVIPKYSPFFCKWDATSTPNPDIGNGEIFFSDNQPTSDELMKLIVTPGIQFFRFQLSQPKSMGITEYSERIGLQTATVSQGNVTLDAYLESQFLCVIDTIGTFHKVWYPSLTLKGKQVRFNMIHISDGWIGNAVFRPAWERYCRHKD